MLFCDFENFLSVEIVSSLKDLTLEQCSLLTSENYMMVLKAKLEISCSSTIVIKEVFAKSQRIRSYQITKSRYQSSVVDLNRHHAQKPITDWP